MLSANVWDVQYSFLVQYSCRHHKVCTRRTHVCYHLGLFSGNSRCLIFCYILYLCFMFHLQDSIISLRGDSRVHKRQALVSFKKYMPPPLPYFKVNICPLTLPHFASIFFAYLWSFRWPNYIVTLPKYFSLRLPHLNISTGPLSDELDKNSQRTWLSENFSHWNGYSHFRYALDFSYALRIL